MEFKFRSVDARPSSSATISYFSEHAFRGQTVAPITSTMAISSSTQSSTTMSAPPPAPSAFRSPDMRLNPDPFPNPNPRWMIERQLEKERIREEIIAAEIVRRRVLEAEVWRELMWERDSAMRRAAAEGLAFDQDRYGVMRFAPRLHHPFSEDRFGFFSSRTPAAAFDTLSLPPPRLPESVPSEYKLPPSLPPPPTSELNKKDKLIILAKPDPNHSGVKRKTPPMVNASELPPFGLKKKPKEEWSCALCQVTAKSEKVLNQHINGKKHQAKEAGLRAQKLGKSSADAPLSKKTAKLFEPKEIIGIASSKLEATEERELLNHDESSNIIHKKMQDTGTSKGNTEELSMKNKDKVTVGHGLESKEDPKKKKKFKFWCEMCKIGAYYPKVFLAHTSGKKHVAKRQELTQNSVPIASSMGSSEATKEAEDADAGNVAYEKNPTATVMASVEGLPTDGAEAAAVSENASRQQSKGEHCRNCSCRFR